MRETFDGLIARVLAADPSDPAVVGQLADALGGIISSLEKGSPATILLQLALRAVRQVETDRPADSAKLMEAVASAVAIAATGPAEQTAQSLGNIRTAASTLRSLLSLQTYRQVQSAQKAPNDHVTVSDEPSTNSSDGSRGAILSTDMDSALLGEFVAESYDRIREAEAALLALEGNPCDAEQVNCVFRAFHTIKGAAGFLELGTIQDLAHLAESFLASVREGDLKITGPNVDLALRYCDMLREMIEGLDKLHTDDPLSIPHAPKSLVADRSNRPASDTTTGRDDHLDAETHDEPAEREGPSNITNHMVRVGTQRLDDLINMVGELVIAYSLVAQHPQLQTIDSPTLAKSIGHTSKIVRELQGLAMGLRMVPLKATFQKVARLVRDLGRKFNKNVRFLTEGDDTEIDRNMVEALSDPLVHMIRNALDHGIEPAADRCAKGKEETGTLRLRAYHSAGNVVLELHDDGQGLDSAAILAKARQRGLVDNEARLSDEEIHGLIFRPGFSTARSVTDVSGRGVGMDVVKRNVDALCGKIDVESTPGVGTTFTLHLPLTTAIMDALLLRVGPERYLLSTLSVEESFRPAPGAICTVAHRGELVRLRDELFPIMRLSELLGPADAVTEPEQAVLVVVEVHGRKCALMVDELLGQQEVVIKSLGNAFASIPWASGGAILSDGRVGLILDAGEIVRLSQARVCEDPTAMNRYEHTRSRSQL